jgi:phospholipid transport system substrate-binding protein
MIEAVQHVFSDSTRSEDPAKHHGRAAFARVAKCFAAALLLMIAALMMPSPAAAEDAPVAFIRTLGNQAVGVIRSNYGLDQKAAYFNRMIREDFDLRGMARFVLGPQWRLASPEERKQFRKLLVERIVRVYGRRLAEGGNGDFVVSGSRAGPDGVIVASRIVPQFGSPITVEWRLGIIDGQYRIKDVAIDGVSMALAQRSEIGALLSRGGGQVRTLLVAMRVDG